LMGQMCGLARKHPAPTTTSVQSTHNPRPDLTKQQQKKG